MFVQVPFATIRCQSVKTAMVQRDCGRRFRLCLSFLSFHHDARRNILNTGETSRIPRRQFCKASGLIGLSGAILGHAHAAKGQELSKEPLKLHSEDRPLVEGHEPITLLPAKTVLAIIDMQRYFVHRDYPFARTWESLDPGCSAYYFSRVGDLVVPNCQKLQDCFRSTESNIVYTAFGSLRQDGMDMPRWAREDNDLSRGVVGEPMYPPIEHQSCKIDDSLKPRAGELIVPKTTSGPLNSTKLDQMLRTLGIDTLVVAGVVTDVCVTQTAREFADRDFKVVVAEDACATFQENHHYAALETFVNVFGHVCRTASVVEMMTAG